MRIRALLAAVVLLSGLASVALAGAENQTFGPAVTGSMYNGNNADAPAFIAQKTEAQQQSGNQDAQAASHDNKGGQSGTARAGGGG